MVKRDRLAIALQEGELDIVPLTAKVIRVVWAKDRLGRDSEMVFVQHPVPPAFACSETRAALQLSTGEVTVSFDKRLGVIEYREKGGRVFLRELAGSRRLKPDTVMGQRCYVAEQGFESPADEALFGLGQFQDGNFNLRNISRQLIQVNTQIAVPFLYSSKGYGLLWHQYGMTEFNPGDSVVGLSKQDSVEGSSREAEVTTTSGTQKVSQRQALYSGSFTVSKAGSYCMMLDLGNMDNRHLLVIDGRAVIDESNLWLPPAAGKMVELTAGMHTVQVVCRAGNVPRLSWRLATNETTFRSPNASCLDYVVFAGRDADEVIGGYRDLSGNVPLLPLWAYGFWQCRERYSSGEHLVRTVEEFRKRRLPLDVIVQDWQYWGKYGWGVPKFDEDHYPDPGHFIGQLHDLHAHFVLSVWENLDKKSEVARPYVASNLYLPNSPWIDIFKPETRKTHWAALNDNLFRYGVDGWWMDATEPENDALKGKQTYFGPGDLYRLTYPLFVSRAVYEGQRAADPSKRVCILTRSAFAGQQRYGTINWSGDIGGTWDSYRRQIVAGLDYMMTGLPYWTTDIGGFFRPGKGQYTDAGYRELLTRWFQWGALNPVFRIHGYQTETEPWNYGDTVMENMRTMLDLRYRLMPYIYGTAWQVTRHGSTMMRPLVMDFGGDAVAGGQRYEYMFGKALLVAPVTEPDVRAVEVYLPRGAGWYDFWTGKRYEGGRVRVDAPLERMPMFVRAGSVLPMGPVVQSTAEARGDSLEIRVYAGANGQFTLYSDEGDGYNYEKGKYQEIALRWDDARRVLSIGAVSGGYAGALKQRVFRVVGVDGNVVKMVRYTGKAMAVTLAQADPRIAGQEKLYRNEFPLSDVKLLDGPFARARDLNIATLLKYDVDRLLAGYRKEAGLSPRAQIYANWEGLDGHIAGHYLSALAMNVAATGNAECRRRMLYMLNELKECQEANAISNAGWGKGYVGAVPNGAKIWSTLKNGDFAAYRAAWVPWYNVHKLYAGLRDAWVFTGNETARSLFLGFCDWGIAITAGLSEAQMQSMLDMEHGGMNEIFADAYQLTGDEKFLVAAKRFSHRMLLDAMAAGKDNLDNKHANTQIPKVIGFERIGEVGADDYYERAGRFFWETVTTNRTLAFGGNSRREFFPAPASCYDFINDVEGPESCNSYNMLKLTEDLFRMEPLARYMDYYERTVYNHILSTQDPETGGYVYFTPVRPESYRVYSAPNEAMWCCVGSGMENHGKYNELIYTHSNDSLFVNHFIASELNWRAGSVKLRQETAFPYEEQSKLTVTEGAADLCLLVRYPSWVAEGALKVLVNGKAVAYVAHPSSYVAIRRRWKKGDVINVVLPMHNTIEHLPHVPSYIAILHGPIVLAAKTGTEDMKGLIADDSRWGQIPSGRKMPVDKAPIIIGDDPAAIAGQLKPVTGKPLNFTLPENNLINAGGLVLEPFYRVHSARYMLYWMAVSKAQYRSYTDSISGLEKEKLELQKRTVDFVAPGEQQPEADHGMEMSNSRTGNFSGEFWRSAAEGGYFSYSMATGEETGLSLVVRYWGAEWGGRKFDLYIDDAKLLTEDNTGKWNQSSFQEVTYPIPDAMIKGKKMVRVKFQALPGNTAGAVYYLRLVRAKAQYYGAYR